MNEEHVMDNEIEKNTKSKQNGETVRKGRRKEPLLSTWLYFVFTHDYHLKNKNKISPNR